MNLRVSCLVCAAALLVLVGGCAVQQGKVESSAPPVPARAFPPPPAAGAPGVVNPAVPPALVAPPAAVAADLSAYPRSIGDQHVLPVVLTLYHQAQAARAAGHPDQAKVALERALHIDPNDPFVWQGLAGVWLDMGDPEQAENAALNSNHFAHGNPFVEGGNWRLIASARQAQGDSAGASEAQSRVEGIDRLLGQPAQ